MEVTRFTHPCDHCGVDDQGAGKRAAILVAQFGGDGAPLAFCESYVTQNWGTIKEKAESFTFLGPVPDHLLDNSVA